MATTERDYDPQHPEASLDDSIAYYERFDDEASRCQVRRLRRIRERANVVTVACPSALNR